MDRTGENAGDGLEPEIRAPVLRLYLRGDGNTPADVAALRAGIGPEGVERIERAAATEWLPISLEVAMLRSLEAARGDEGVREVTRRLGRNGWSIALFQPLLTATAGMLGRRPGMLLRFGIASWHLAMRRAGTGRIIEEGAGTARILHEGLPPDWDPLLVVRVCTTLEALLELGRVSPRAEAEYAPGSGRVVYLVSWR